MCAGALKTNPLAPAQIWPWGAVIVQSGCTMYIVQLSVLLVIHTPELSHQLLPSAVAVLTIGPVAPSGTS